MKTALRSTITWVAAAISICAHVVIVVRVMAALSSTDPSALIADHDGGFFALQSEDPFAMSLSSGIFDRPAMRIGRVAYPLLVWLLPFGTFWGMLVVNLCAVVVGVVGTSRLSRWYGRSAWLGLAFGLNPAALASTRLLLADTVMMAALVWTVVFVLERRHLRVAVVGSIAILTKETAIFALAAVGLYRLVVEREWEWGLLAALPVPVAWMISVGLRFGWNEGTFNLTGFGRGFVNAWILRDRAGPGEIPLMLLVATLVPVMLWMAWRYPSPATWVAAVTFGMLPWFIQPVWVPMWNLVRAVGPSFPLIAATGLPDRTHTGSSPQTL